MLKDKEAEIYMGYDSKNKRNDWNRRVTIINEDNYVVVIQIIKDNRAKFVTAYVADSPNTAKSIRQGPKWTKK